MSMIHHYARNGALAAVGLYLVAALTLLTLSASLQGVESRPFSSETSMPLLSRLSQALPALLQR